MVGKNDKGTADVVGTSTGIFSILSLLLADIMTVSAPMIAELMNTLYCPKWQTRDSNKCETAEYFRYQRARCTDAAPIIHRADPLEMQSRYPPTILRFTESGFEIIVSSRWLLFEK